MRYSAVLVPAFAVVFLAGCSLPTTVAEKLQPYRINVRQGNYVDQAMVAQLRKGMSQDQVRFVLGTPLLVDIFHSDRWDYVYTYRPGGGAQEERRISVFFADGKLDYVEGDVIAGAAPQAATSAAPSRVIDLTGPMPVAPPPEESSSWWKFW